MAFYLQLCLEGHHPRVASVFPFVVCNSLQALPHSTSVGAGVVRFDLCSVAAANLPYLYIQKTNLKLVGG
jgi:hypothetical protein